MSVGSVSSTPAVSTTEKAKSKYVTGKLTDEQIEKLNEISKDKANNDKLKAQAMDKDAFLKILMTQIQHQDPMSPLKDQEFIGQMAQFSSVEQLGSMSTAMKQTNETLDAIGILMTNMNSSLVKMNEKLDNMKPESGDGDGDSATTNKELLDQLKAINESITKMSAKIE